ncbi:hypothetical protein Tco_1525930 [Tanacetum coccineum]
MPKAIHRDHQDTAYYIPKHHQTPVLSGADRAIFKNLERRFFHEGCVVTSSYFDDSNIRQIFSAIKFYCLLDIDEQICPLFVLEFYKSVRITQNVNKTISIAFIIRSYEIVLPLHQFSHILCVPCEGACIYTIEWSIAALPRSIDPNPIYLTPLDDSFIVCDAIFNERPSPKRLTKKGEMIVHDPFQTELSEMKLGFRKWESILSENVISLSGNKDHLNACLVYMLFYLANRKPFNLSYYIVKRIVRVIKNVVMVLLYGMLLTRLYRHVLTIQPCPLTDAQFFIDHVMVPLTKGRVRRFLVDGKRPHPQTYSSSSSTQSQPKIKNKSTRLTATLSASLSIVTNFHPFLEEHRRNLSKQKACSSVSVTLCQTLERRRRSEVH